MDEQSWMPAAVSPKRENEIFFVCFTEPLEICIIGYPQNSVESLEERAKLEMNNKT